MSTTSVLVDEEKENAEDVLSTEDVLSKCITKVSTDKEKVSTDRLIVSTDGSKVSTDRQKESTDEQNEATDDQNEGTDEQNKGTDDHTEEGMRESYCLPVMKKARKVQESGKTFAESFREEREAQFTIKEEQFIHDTIAAQRKIPCSTRSEAIGTAHLTKNQLRKSNNDMLEAYEDFSFLLGSTKCKGTHITILNEKGIDFSKMNCKEDDKEEEKRLARLKAITGYGGVKTYTLIPVNYVPEYNGLLRRKEHQIRFNAGSLPKIYKANLVGLLLEKMLPVVLRRQSCCCRGMFVSWPTSLEARNPDSLSLIVGEKPPKDNRVASDSEENSIDQYDHLCVSQDVSMGQVFSKIAKFLMGLDEVYAPIRIIILTTDHIPDVKGNFATLSRDESHNSTWSHNVSKNGNGNFAFMFKTNNRSNNWSNSNKNQNQRLNRPNLLCTHYNMNGHNADRCFDLVGYPSYFKKRNGSNQGGSSNATILSTKDQSSTSSNTFINEQVKRLMTLISEKSRSGSIPANVADVSKLNMIVGHPNGIKAVVTHIGSLSLTDKITINDVLVVPDYQDLSENCDPRKDKGEHPDNSAPAEAFSDIKENATLDVNDNESEGDDGYYQEFNDMYWSHYMHAPMQSYLKHAFRVLRYLKNSPRRGNKAMNSVTCEVIQIMKILNELNVKVSLPVTINYDNSSEIQIATNLVFHQRTKHFEIKLVFLREKVVVGIVKTVKVKSEDNVADVFTNGLSVVDHNKFCRMLKLKDLYHN
ncbi:ribonuclease H-like domain-containing protein [Tanacetum coccineum]